MNKIVLTSAMQDAILKILRKACLSYNELVKFPVYIETSISNYNFSVTLFSNPNSEHITIGMSGDNWNILMPNKGEFFPNRGAINIFLSEEEVVSLVGFEADFLRDLTAVTMLL